MRLVFSNEAKADLIRIGDHIAKDSPRRAISFVNELEERCRRLVDLPLAYPLLQSTKSSGIRRRVHGKYLIFYRVGKDDTNRRKY